MMYIILYKCIRSTQIPECRRAGCWLYVLHIKRSRSAINRMFSGDNFATDNAHKSDNYTHIQLSASMYALVCHITIIIITTKQLRAVQPALPNSNALRCTPLLCHLLLSFVIFVVSERRAAETKAHSLMLQSMHVADSNCAKTVSEGGVHRHRTASHRCTHSLVVRGRAFVHSSLSLSLAVALDTQSRLKRILCKCNANHGTRGRDGCDGSDVRVQSLAS